MPRICGIILTKRLYFENNIEIIALFRDSVKRLGAFFGLFIYSCGGRGLPVAEFSSFPEAAVYRSKVLHWVKNYN